MDPNNVRRLQQAFEGDKPDREVKLDDIKQFLRLAASEHHLAALDVDAVANSIIDDGYTSAHMVSEMDRDDLVSVGMLRAHAKLVVRYLNGVDPPNRVQVIPQALPSAHADPAVIAAAVAAAVTGLKKADRLKAHDGLVAVSAVREWALEHAELSKEMMPAVSDAIRDIRSDPSFDVAPLLLDADFAQMDTAYAHRVRTSLSEDQMDDMGGADATSAVSIVQSVLKYVVRSQQEIYIAHYTASTELGPAVKPEATKDRFRLFQDRLTEVRYHPSFELKIAIKVLARVLQCDTFMSNSVMGEWERSAKDQKALSAVISEVRRIGWLSKLHP